MSEDPNKYYPGQLKGSAPKPMTVEEATRAIYEATNNMRWISVRDRLPSALEKVLIPGEHGETSVGVLLKDGTWDDLLDCSSYDGSPYGMTNPPTHWMPLPPAPKP